MIRLTSQPVRIAGDVESMLDLGLGIGAGQSSADAHELLTQGRDHALGERSIEFAQGNIGGGAQSP